MGLKGFRLWVMGQLDSNVQSPAALARRQHQRAELLHQLWRPPRDVALQVAFERQTLKPVFSLDRL
jgi:hypothetical protein